jgi:proline iminopeptidase
MSAGRDLFPDIEPYDSGTLKLDHGHVMYWEECGRRDGQAALFLHGGPGSGCWPLHRRFFDPQHYRVVLFDQRGAGRSRPAGFIEANTTQTLVADIERLRQALGIDSWLLLGGSWGSTLALAYAQAHPERVSALVLRGIFLGGRREIDWFMHGMGRIFPEARRDFLAAIPEAEHADLLAAYYRRLIHPDPKVHRPPALAWSRYESRCSTLLPDRDSASSVAHAEAALCLARIEAHYFVNDCFLKPDQLLEGCDRLGGVPVEIVQGRYDVVCPIESADRLARALPSARYTIVPDAGHAASEPGTRRALVAATERLKRLK